MATQTSPASQGGVAVPQKTGEPNPDVPAATKPVTSSPDTSGGTSASSGLNSKPTPKGEKLAAANGGSTRKVFQVYPTVGHVPTPVKDATDLILADWYRNGRVDKGGTHQLARQISPWEHDEKPASIRCFGLRKNARGETTEKDVELIPAYTKFLLESAQESHVERSQIVETFGEFFVFFFGERPPMYSFSGTLMNTKNVNWVSDFKFWYDQYLRGTKCVENNARLLLTYGGRQIEGFMLNMQTQTEASMEAGVKVNFSFVVTRKTFLSFSEDFGTVVSNGLTINDAEFTKLLQKIAGIEGAGLADPKTSLAADVTKSIMAGGSPIQSFSPIA